MSVRLVLFAKRPRPGRVKTRLEPELGAERTLALYRAFVCDQLRLLRSMSERCEIELCLDGPPDDSSGLGGVPISQQGDGDLGARLSRCSRRVHAEGAAGCVFVGTDSPTLPRSILEAALRGLEEGRQVVVSPAQDGGYVLLGIDRPYPELFDGMPWGTARVWRETRDRATAAGRSLLQIEPWYDVDDGTGLLRLVEELSTPAGRARAPETARVLEEIGRL
ncbi:MAG: glycosyltransferase [bacterium]|nr:glycosyltransferase [bacterium]